MSKTATRSIVTILIFLIIFILIWLYYDMVKQEPANANVVDANLEDENKGLDNVINELFIEVNQVSEDNEIEDKKEALESNQQTTSDSVTSKEEKAVNLVKEEWGRDTSVYFSNMGIDNDGRYIVSVNKKDSTVLAWYLVDVDKELVTRKE